MNQNRTPKAPVKQPEVVDLPSGLRAIADRDYFKSMRYMEQQWVAVRPGAHPAILEFEKRFIKRMATLWVPMYAPVVVRSHMEQRRRYVEGESEIRAGMSPHEYGMAVDIQHCRMETALSPYSWLTIAHLGKETAQRTGIAIKWGGLANPNHWEMAGWTELRDGYPFRAWS